MGSCQTAGTCTDRAKIAPHCHDSIPSPISTSLTRDMDSVVRNSGNRFVRHRKIARNAFFFSTNFSLGYSALELLVSKARPCTVRLSSE